ncbi:MAG: gamma carbonic anhydrase family protein [Gemmatimonadetes bacterium]|nr:gamma carbonic anhydrase family protein [Gemmatimonadota bacterium]
MPYFHPTSFIHPLAIVIGDVTLGSRASVWPSAVLRGDGDVIVVGPDTNVQDGAILHVDPGLPLSIGARVTIGHRAIVHGATIEDDCLVGMGCIILNRAVVGAGSVIAAGAVVPEGMVIRPGSVVMGVPAKVTSSVDDAMRERVRKNAQSYVALQARHRAGEFVTHSPSAAR